VDISVSEEHVVKSAPQDSVEIISAWSAKIKYNCGLIAVSAAKCACCTHVLQERMSTCITEIKAFACDVKQGDIFDSELN
jgi:hypothetical protein